jgi:calcineurin-like phosphoesterase family protein
MKIVVNPGQRVFFTSDTHYNHTNICRGVSKWDGARGTRDYESLNQMNIDLQDNINMLVMEDDILIHLGDWSFGGFDRIAEFRNKLNCKNIHLFLGNHDHHILNNKDNVQDLFASVNEQRMVTIVIQPTTKGEAAKKYRFVMSHYPLASWQDMGQGVMHVHGHIHTPHQFKVGPGRMMDVGIDGSPDFQPYTIDQVLKLIADRPIQSLLKHEHDHHNDAMTC